jgi:hypothetical protein
VSVDAQATDPGDLAARVAAALAAAEIPPSKLGPARRAATAGRPSSVEVRAAAEQLGLEPDSALETLAREDLVHRGADGEIAVAYPFSGRPTTHQVRFPGGHEVDAMCAIDALGIAPMFGQAIEIESRDPLTGEKIHARVSPDASVEWSPQSSVVVAGAIRSQGDACCGCCPVLNFFASAANAEAWLAEHQEVLGNVISMGDAAAAGRAVFGDVLTES